jgi:hypothetical protein
MNIFPTPGTMFNRMSKAMCAPTPPSDMRHKAKPKPLVSVQLTDRLDVYNTKRQLLDDAIATIEAEIKLMDAIDKVAEAEALMPELVSVIEPVAPGEDIIVELTDKDVEAVITNVEPVNAKLATEIAKVNNGKTSNKK